MEIAFNKLTYIENKSSSNEKRVLDNVNVIIEQGSIVSFINDDLSILGNLMMLSKRPTSGCIIYDDVKFNRTSHIKNSKELKKKLGFVNTDMSVMFLEKTVKDEINVVLKNYDSKYENNNKHIVDSLVIAGLNESFLDRDPNTLSFVEKKKLKFACVMSYNPQVLILNEFEKGLSFKEREYFRKLFLKLKSKFGKTIILLSSRVEFLFDFVDKMYVINNGNLVLSGGQELFYDNSLYKYVDIPKIVEFTKYVHDEGHNIIEYTDFKELIKELYRHVG